MGFLAVAFSARATGESGWLLIGLTGMGAITSMISGFASVILFKFVFSNMEGIGKYFVELDVLAPSFALAMIVGYIVSKMFPNKGIKDL